MIPNQIRALQKKRRSVKYLVLDFSVNEAYARSENPAVPTPHNARLPENSVPAHGNRKTVWMVETPTGPPVLTPESSHTEKHKQAKTNVMQDLFTVHTSPVAREHTAETSEDHGCIIPGFHTRNKPFSSFKRFLKFQNVL